MKTVRHYSTIGLLARHNNFKTHKLVRVCFDVKENNSVKVYAVSGNSLGIIKNIPQIYITREELASLDDDPYDDVVFAKAAFALLNLSVV